MMWTSQEEVGWSVTICEKGTHLSFADVSLYSDSHGTFEILEGPRTFEDSI